MILDQSIVDMYEKSRSNQFLTALQQIHSVLEPFAQVVPVNNGKYFQMPAVGTTEVLRRSQRHEDIVAEELTYNNRAVKGEMFQKFLKRSTDDDQFLNNLPANLTQLSTELSHAAERAKDEVLMGTCRDANEDSATFGQYIIKTPTTLFATAVDGSPYKGGATGGLLGANYCGEDADEKVSLEWQPFVEGKKTALADWTKYTGSMQLDLKRTNVVPVNYVKSGTPAASGFTLDKFLVAYQALQARYATQGGGQVCMAITHKQVLELMTDEKFQNSLYGHQVLKTGFVDSLLGVKFLICDTLPLVNVGTTAAPKYVRVCPMWTRDNLVQGVWQNAKFRIIQPDNKIDTMMVGVTFTLGAGRKREEAVVGILCDEGFATTA